MTPILAAAFVFSGLTLAADEPPVLPPEALTEPLLVDGQLVFPPGAAIPRSLTRVEREWLANNPPIGDRAGGPPPTGPLHCAAEYEPMQAILLSWNGTSPMLTIVATMASRITRYGDAQAWVVVRDTNARTSATTALTNAGADMTKVRFFVRPVDTIWIRDYGPRYIFQGGCRAIVDHEYNRPRPNDDALPAWLGTQLNHPVYSIPLRHGGGNYHLDAVDRSYATRLIVNENPSLSEQTIVDTWHAFQDVDTHLFTPFPTSVDSTQHLDMWMEIIGDDKVMISDWPSNPGSTQDQICDAAAEFMSARGYTVFRLPAFSVSGTHYTYCNVVTCNNLLLLPTYTNATVQPFNAAALATWQAALPGKVIAQVNCQAIVTSAGVMHCIA
ncbi:MAG: agmatine deiminase family protein, partial [Planctomycetota bacterium]